MTKRERARRRDPDREARRLARRDELVDAALRVLRREGPNASMELIAAEAGVTKPIFYRHFGDRDGLARAIADRFLTELMRDLRAALAREAAPRDILVATIDAYVRFVERDPEIYRFLIQQVSGAADPVVGFMRQVGQEVSLVLGEQLRAVGADSGAAEPWAYALVGMVHLAGDWWVDRRTMPRRRLVEYLTQLAWDGMGRLTVVVPDDATALEETVR